MTAQQSGAYVVGCSKHLHARLDCAACRTPGPNSHQRGEFVLGLGWSCLDCDTFGCTVVNAPSGPRSTDA